MLPIGHFACGAGVAFLVNILLYLLRRCKTTFRHLLWMPISIVLAGFWAFGPDWVRLFKYLLGQPYAYSSEAHKPGWPDIFFFHGYLDKYFPDRGTIVGLATLILIFLATNLLLLREINRLRKDLKGKN